LPKKACGNSTISRSRANRDLGTRIDQAWLDRVRLASVRIGGPSGGLVSREGLIFTNEHVASGCVEDLSTQERNYVQTGFTPSSRAGELKCPGMVAEVLTQRNAYGYDPEVNRSVLVTAAATTAALRHAYGMDHLLRELGVGR